jgi:hypothetical protein
MSQYMGFCPKIENAVALARLDKLWRKACSMPKRRHRRKPRFCITTTLRLCPRQRAKKYKTS